jgi:hypothetical protein
LAPTAGLIVVLIGGFFNCHGLNPGIRPLVELDPIEADALLPDRELANIGANRFVEFIPAHAEIAVSLAGTNKAREDGRDLSRASI